MSKQTIILKLTVFLCGAIVMVFEILGSRVLGPYLGTSVFVWTSLIGIILGSLSLGYWLGGKLSDQQPRLSLLGAIVLMAALMIGITSVIQESFLEGLSRQLPGIKLPAVLSSIVLFAPAGILLGMVTPYAVRLKIKDLSTSGRTVGNLYAISTIGSIAGTFSAGFLLLPAFGTSVILYSLAFLLIFLAMLILAISRIRKTIWIWLCLPLPLLGFFATRNPEVPHCILDTDTQYNRVRILDVPDPFSGKPSRIMMINNELSSAMFTGSDSLVFPYTRYYKLAEHFVPGFRKSLMIGGAGYSFPKYYLEHYPEATMDVVEIDPEVTRLAFQYFRLQENPRLNIIHEDGRTFLNRATRQYDVILGDAYKSMYSIPWQLTTIESVQRQYDILSDNGAVILNIISAITGPGSRFLQAETKTYQQIFPQVFLFKAINGYTDEQMQSIILVALKSTSEPDFSSTNTELHAYLQTQITILPAADAKILTDEYAPVDYYALQALE